MSRRERRLRRIEQRNDQALVGMLVPCTGIGFFLSALTGGTLSAIGYGLLGALIGAPASFIVDISRRLFV